MRGEDGTCNGLGQNQCEGTTRGQQEQVKSKASHNQSLGQQTHVLVANTTRDDVGSSGPEYNYKYDSYMTKKKPT